MTSLIISPQATPGASLVIASEPQKARKQPPSNRSSSLDFEAARKARHEQRQEWSQLDLRQDLADETVMRGYLKAAKVRVADSSEPATVKRVRQILRRAGFDGVAVQETVGTSIEGFLQLNQKLPLWAAVALVLEASCRFTLED